MAGEGAFESTEQQEPELSLEGTIAIMQELQGLLTKQEEVKEIMEIKQKFEEMGKTCLEQDLSAKELIRALTAKNQDMENSLAPPISEEEKVEELRGIQEQQETCRREIDRLRKEIEGTTADAHEIGSQVAALEETLKDSRTQQSVEVPRVSYSLSLYATISGIQWDYGRKDAVSGVISRADEMREFSFDASTQSRFEIAEALWGLIDPATQTA